MARKQKGEATTKYVTKEEAGLAREKKTVVVERELTAIVEMEGCVTAQRIVDAAADENHPLHKYFEWDDTAAARKYRLVQASQMIIATKFVAVLKDNEDRLPEVVHATPVRKLLPSLGDGFQLRTDVLSEEESRRAIVERKKSALKAWCRSVVDIEELHPLKTTIEKGLGLAG